MIPFLAYPLALAALATVPALAAIYILRNRFRRRRVSSLVLWRFQVQSKSGGARVNRLQLPLLFFLELLALVLLVTAAAGPHWEMAQSRRPLIVILDDSLSMRAVDGGVSAQARARSFLKELFQGQTPPATTLILAGSEPRSLGVPVRSWREVDQLLSQWKCWAPDAAIDSALTLAAELGRQQANLLVLTDHRPPEDKISNPRLEWHASGSGRDNVAFVNASRTAFSEQDRCLLELANFSAHARTVELLLQAGSNAVQGSRVTLGAHENQRIVFNVPAGGPALKAVLPDDALPEDNEVQLLPPIRKRVRVRVALTDENLSSLAGRALDATGLRAAVSENPELVVQEHDTPAGSNVWSLVWSALSGTNAYTGPFMVDASHPLAAGIALEGAVWSAAAFTNRPGDVPVILAGNTPLLSVRENTRDRRRLLLNLNPELSTLQNTPDWPILFWNMLQWRIAEMPGLRESNARLGTEVNLKTGGDEVHITLPDGEERTLPGAGGELALETPMPGIYAVAIGRSTNTCAVNVLVADESDLSACIRGKWGRWTEDAGGRREETSLVWAFGLFALALLTLHLYLVATAKGGS